MKISSKRAEYSAYLRSSEWRARRELTLDRAGRKCERCGNRRDLHVHHLSYKHFKNEPLEDLMVLCKECHFNVHKKKLKVVVLPDATRKVATRKKKSKPKPPQRNANAKYKTKISSDNDKLHETFKKNREKREMLRSWKLLK